MLSYSRARQLVSAFKCGFKDQFSKPHPQSETYTVTTYQLEKNIVQRQGDQLKGEFDRICKLRGSTFTKIFPIPHNTGHYCEKAKAQIAQSPLRSQLSFKKHRMEESRQAAAAEGPSPQDELWALSCSDFFQPCWPAAQHLSDVRDAAIPNTSKKGSHLCFSLLTSCC